VFLLLGLSRLLIEDFNDIGLQFSS